MKTGTTGPSPTLQVLANGSTNRISTGTYPDYTYDANGNVTGLQGQYSATYDMENRLATYTPNGKGAESYSYGPDNVRVYKKYANGLEELHFYGAFAERMGKFDVGTGKTLERRITFGGFEVWRVTNLNGPINWSLGSFNAWDRVGSSASNVIYPYGEPLNPPSTDLEEFFATYYVDGTSGLDYAQNRYYSSTLGRFMSPDPYHNSAGPADPGSWNRYAYAGDDPVNFNDPTGLDGESANGWPCGEGWITDASLTGPCPHSDSDLGGNGGGGGGLPCGFGYGTACGIEPPVCVSALGSSFAPGGGGGQNNPYCPPPPPPPPCIDDIQMFTRPVDFVPLSSHSYLEITSVNGTLMDTVEGGPKVLRPGGPQMLVGLVDPGGTGLASNDPSNDRKFGGTLVVPCSQADAVVGAALSFKPVLYNGFAGVLATNLPAGANSNTFMHWLLNTAKLSFYYPTPPPGAFGWYNSIP